MEFWLVPISLILLGSITYFIVKRSVAGISRTPVWLLWLVLMTPSLIWAGWLLLFGEDVPMPAILVMGPFIICPLFYFYLIQKGLIKPEEKKENNSSTPDREENTAKTTSMAEESEKLRPINQNEEAALRKCFPWGVYYLQHIDYRPQAILCLGKLRSVPEEAYKRIKTNVEELFGDRFLIIFQENFQGQPFFVLVPNPFKENKEKLTGSLTNPGLALALLLITLFTSTLAGLAIMGLSWNDFISNPGLFIQGLPYSLGLIFILGAHEFSHYFTATYYKISTSLPHFIPAPWSLNSQVPFLGTLGAFVQMRSPIPDRKALFDIAIAGPLAGLVVTIPLLLWGLSLSAIVDLPEQTSLFNIEALDPRFSLLLSLLGKIALGSQFIPEKAIDLHPLAIAGYIGLIMAALNLMPVGQLDGGQIVHAVFGQRTAAVIGQVACLLMFVLGLVQPDLFIWAIILIFLSFGARPRPALNDVSELDNWRDMLGLLCLVVLISILLPLPGTVAQWFNI